MSNSHGSPVWYELMTRDPDAAKTFYDAVVGWNVEGQPAGEMDYRMITADFGNAGGVMRISDAMAEGGAKAVWLGYFGVDDVDACVADMTAHGGGVLMPAWSIPGVGRMALVSDPEGIPFYIMRGDSEESSTVFSATDAGHVRWNELMTPDLDGALDFYTGRFGWKKEDAMDMGPEMGPYQFFSHDDVTLGAMMRQSGAYPKGWSFYFGVPDIDAAAAAVTAGGGQIVMGPMEIPGGEYSANAIDPEGVSFGLVGPRK